MAAFNRIIIVGNLTRDPEFKQLPSGQGVCRLGLASNRQIKNRQSGMQMQEVCYVDVDVWGPQAESCNKYLQKGRAVLVEGRLKFDSWKDAEGATKSKHSIVADRVVFLNSGANAEEGTEDQLAEEQPTPAARYTTQDTNKFRAAQEKIEVQKTQQKKKLATKDSVHVEMLEDMQPTIQGSAKFKDEPPFDEELPF
jgi:single-strand DNA-binding protein